MGATSSKKWKKTNKTTQLQREGKWTIHQNPATHNIATKIVQIKDSIWYSTDHKDGEQGMVQYCLITNTVKNIVKYPEFVQPSYHCVCCLNNIIYIIDGFNGYIISFNPSNNEFGSKIEMVIIADYCSVMNIGDYCSAVAIDGKIHIYNGMHNDKSLSYIYDPNTNEVKSVKDIFASRRMSNVAILNCPQIPGKLLRFGGYNNEKKTFLDCFLVRFKIKDALIPGYVRQITGYDKYPVDIINVIMMFSDHDEYSWMQLDAWELKYKMYDFGYILYDHYIITFGGYSTPCIFTDEVFILDVLNQDKGWIESNIKCPKNGAYIAILTSNETVHLFGFLVRTSHHSIAISEIFKDL